MGHSTNKQESKHNHAKAALDGVKNGLRGGTARHMQWTLGDNYTNYARNGGIDVPGHTNMRLTLLNHLETGRHADIIGLMSHVDTDEECFGSSLLKRHRLMGAEVEVPAVDGGTGQGGDEEEEDEEMNDMLDDTMDDGLVGSAFEDVLESGAQQLPVQDRDEFRSIARQLKDAAAKHLARTAVEPAPIGAGGATAGSTAGTAAIPSKPSPLSWVLKSSAAVRDCLGLPFHTIAEVILHHRLRDQFKVRDSWQRLELFSAAFNQLVPLMRARGHRLDLKSPQHIQAHETRLDNLMLGYKNVVDALSPLGKKFFEVKGRLEKPLAGDGGRRIHKLVAQPPTVDVAAAAAAVQTATGPASAANVRRRDDAEGDAPAAGNAPAAKKVKRKMNEVGKVCQFGCDNMLAEDNTCTSGKQQMVPTSPDGNFHLPGFCPIKLAGTRGTNLSVPIRAISAARWAAYMKTRRKKEAAANIE